MTLQFPSSPINGAVSGDYTYDATKGAWRKNAALPVSVTHSDVAPSNPQVGDQWWKSNEGTLFTYYNDGSSSQWVESTNVIANVEPNPIPAGSMMAWASDIIPANWLLCDGSAVSRSTYASLFAIIGTQYGSGDGTTTFNLPNLKGRTIVGKDSAQTEFDVLGETGGAKTHTLTTAEMPSHTHIQDAHNHTQNPHNHTQDPHTHSLSGTLVSSFVGYGQNSPINGNATNPSSGGVNSTTATNQATTATNNATTATNQSTGGGGAHNNLQPYIILNYIIKFSAGETPGDSQLAVRVGTLETQNNATPLSQNYVINGAFDVWQRGTTSLATGGYTADRWYLAGSNVTAARESTTVVPGSQFSLRATMSGAGQPLLYQAIETANAISLAGQTVTLSAFMASNVSVAGYLLVEWSANNDNALTGVWTQLTGTVTPTLTSTLTRYSSTVTIPSTARSIRILCSPNVTLASGNTFTIDNVQLESGQYATPFRRNAPSIQAELAECQRYYYQSAQAYGFYNIFNSGNMQSTTFRFPVTMRTTTPAITVYDNVGTVNRITIANAGGTSQNGITPPASMQLTADGFMWVAGGMGGTVGNNGMVYMSRFDANAEL